METPIVGAGTESLYRKCGTIGNVGRDQQHMSTIGEGWPVIWKGDESIHGKTKGSKTVA